MKIEKNLKKFFNQEKIIPLKSLGQNFLTNDSLLKKIAEAADIKKTDVVVEIGTGTGNLTVLLAQKAKKLISIEKDKKLSLIAKQRFEKQKNVKIISGDVLKTDLETIGVRKNNYKIVANLPYNITGIFFRKFFTSKTVPKLVIILVQQEVASRIINTKPPHNLLELAVQFYGSAHKLFDVSPDNFWPKPKVQSSVLKIEIQNNKNLGGIEKIFFEITRACFAKKRKIAITTLSRYLSIEKKHFFEIFKHAHIDFSARPEEISLSQWITISTDVAHIRYNYK